MGFAYEGTEPYIFVSYAHSDNDKVLALIEALQNRGFRIWYDIGIEVGSEWPEYIARHLLNSSCVIGFISPAAAASHNCKSEITYAIDKRKPFLCIYLEDFELSPGMEMQLGTLQAIYYYRHKNDDSFLKSLCDAAILKPCLAIKNETVATPANPSESETPKRNTSNKEKKTAKVQNNTKKNKQSNSKNNNKATPITKPELFTYVIENNAIVITGLKVDCPGSINIPSHINGMPVTAVGDEAFYCCDQLSKVILPETVTTIGNKAFYYCTQLMKVILPKSITAIGDDVFSHCFNLTTITLPDSVSSIGKFAFHFCEKLSGITIPNGVTSIRQGTFFSCSQLANAILPDSILSIESSAFGYCEKLTDIIIPSSTLFIGSNAFSQCKSLSSITIPKDCQLADNVFEDSKLLSMINFI